MPAMHILTPNPAFAPSPALPRASPFRPSRSPVPRICRPSRPRLLARPRGASARLETPSPDGRARAASSPPPADAAPAAQSLEEKLDPVAARVRGELAADGVDMDELLNAGKVVGLTRKLDALALDFDALPADDDARRARVAEKMDAVRRRLEQEKRQVMQGWLKNVFVGQALLFVAVGGLLANDAVPGVESVPLVGRALGFWTTWLFSIPALRARKGIAKGEKSALNVAFLATPLMNVAMPFFTKNCGAIWAVDVAVLAGAYAWYVVGPAVAGSEDGGEGETQAAKEEGRITGILKWLDWGSWR